MRTVRVLILGACLPLLFAARVSTATSPLLVEASLIEAFVSSSSETVFGKLQFLGGFSYRSSDSRLGGVSSIRFRPDGRAFIAVLDTGDWMLGSIIREPDGQLSGLRDVAITPMQAAGGAGRSKLEGDAEGLALRDDELIVSYERRHRILAFPDRDFNRAPSRALEMLIPRRELRANGGIETLAVAPKSHALQGALVAIAESSIDGDGNLFAAVLDGPQKGIFKVKRDAPWAVTDGAFLPDGDLLLLERRFSFTGGVGMRIRRIAGDTIRPGAVVDGETLIEAGMGAEIDNMEGLDVVPGADGDLRIILVSDDNRSFFQRNLMLEFRLLQ